MRNIKIIARSACPYKKYEPTFESNTLPLYEEPLTRREKEILQRIVDGKSNIEIAKELFVSMGTTKHHVSNIITKMGVANRIQAAVHAVTEGVPDADV